MGGQEPHNSAARELHSAVKLVASSDRRERAGSQTEMGYHMMHKLADARAQTSEAITERAG